jgi:DNA end-binding protein Ku
MKDTLGPSQAHREPEVGAILAQQVRGPIRAALIDLINQKRAGKPIVPQERPRGENVVDLMEALRKSVGGAGSESKLRRRAPRSHGRANAA